ncbi:nitroreductase family protein, partial [Streptomyces boncukensis]|uniref:nitroreductase family protein n=1 Tax=Streptomyces boncukensis TaxID=2711219 RepID=UPI003B96C6EC
PAGGLRTLAEGEARPTLARWAAGQPWIAGCGAMLLAHGCPQDADAARVRGEHLAAGYAIGVAQVAAGALGLASRPVGSWQGADLGAALGAPEGRHHIVHGLALGRGRTRPEGARGTARSAQEAPQSATNGQGQPAPGPPDGEQGEEGNHR